MRVFGSDLKWLLAAAVVVYGCADAKGIQEEAASSLAKGPPLAFDGPEWTRPVPLMRLPDGEVPDDPTLRRAYGIDDMKLGECTKHGPDGVVIGSKCPN